MRTPMTIPIRFWALVLSFLLIYQFSTDASADWCAFEKNIDKTLDLSGTEVLSISAAAGDLDVVGVAGTSEARISATVCASKQAWLDDSDLYLQDGKRAEIGVDLPETSGWSLMGSNYVRMDLKIEVPQDLALDVRDSSGDLGLRNVGPVELQDSSGDIEIRGAAGAVTISDSSGDMELEDIRGDVTVQSDSSGDIYIDDVVGGVLVVRDSSGDIRVRQVRDDVIVERDSSGGISVADVGGDFRVLRDGSGGISSRNVSGTVDVPEKD